MANDIFLESSRVRPDAVSGDGVSKVARGSVYGDSYVSALPKSRYSIADEGRYFVATNPTPGTGIAGIAAADGLNDAEGLLLLTNDNTDGQRVYLDYLYLRATVAGTNGTDAHGFTVKLDSVPRYTSGGSSITPVNTNMASSLSPGVTCKFGALITTAAGAAARLVSNRVLRRATIVVAGDEFFVSFGAAPSPGVRSGTLAADSTTNVGYSTHMPPVVLGEGQCVWMAANHTSQTVGTSWEFELGFWVR